MRWNLRMTAAERGIWKSTEMRRRLAEAGLEVSAGKMSRWWTTTPVSMRLEDLGVICAVLERTPADPKSPRWESPGKLRRRPVKAASCPDCLAWGVTARHGRMCVACESWRDKHGTSGQCVTCGRQVPVRPDGSCRLCHKHRDLAARLIGRRIETVAPAISGKTHADPPAIH